MTPRDLLQAGKLDEAIDALSAELRDNPTDVRRRTFLFELLCFAGKYDRAEKQLDVVGQGSKEAEMGALLYHSALHAERLRQGMFETGGFPLTSPPKPVSGTLNGKPFESLTDADPRIGARLELFAAGQYTWIPFEHIESMRMLPPKRLRDMLWAPAIVRTAESFRGMRTSLYFSTQGRHSPGDMPTAPYASAESLSGSRSMTTPKHRSAKSCFSSTTRSFQFSNSAS